MLNIKNWIMSSVLMFLVLSLMYISVSATTRIDEGISGSDEDILLTQTQESIDAILQEYLGSTSISIDEMKVIVAEMDWETYQTARWEISELGDSIMSMLDSGDISEESLYFLLESNKLFAEFEATLEEKAALDNSVSTFATNLLLFDEKLSITDNNGSGTGNETAGVTISVTGGLLSIKENTITFTNNASVTKVLKFDYSISGQVEGYSFDASTGSEEVSLSAGGTYTCSVTAKKYKGTATLSLSNISFEDPPETASITVNFDSSLGSITVGGSAASSGNTITGISTSEQTNIVASPANGVTFLGWINENTQTFLSNSTSYSQVFSSDMVLTAAFVKSDGTGNAYYGVGPVVTESTWGVYYYSIPAYTAVFDNLSDAIAYTTSTTSKGIVLLNSGTLPSGDYTIPDDVIFLIPHDTAGTVPKNNPPIITSTQSVNVYRTLTMASGANLTLNGTMSIAASLAASQTTGHNGLPTGNVAQVNMKDGSCITVKDGSFLYAIGFVYGSGSVLVESGGTVYECFQLRDFRGGDATTKIVNNRSTYRLFPLMQYYVQNVQVPMTLYSGAIEYGLCSFNITLLGTRITEVPFIGDEGMFKITRGSIIKDYIENTDRLEFRVDGDLEMNNYSFTLKASAVGITINSADYFFPINHNITVDVQAGNLNVNQDLCLLPGAEVKLQEGTVCTLGSGTEIILYDASEWGAYIGEKYTASETNTYLKPLLYIAGGTIYNRRQVALENLPDASIMVDGTVNAANGYIYSTSSAANIYSTKAGKLIDVVVGSLNKVYQASQKDTEITNYIEIGVIPAVLQDGDGTDVPTDNTPGTYTYYANTQKWCPPGHRYGEGVVTPPTCTEDGYTTSICEACGDVHTSDPTAANGHTEVIDPEVPPTYTTTGLTEGKHCSVCGEVTVEQEVVAKLECPGHQYTGDSDIYCDICKEEATITEKGRTLSYEDYIYVVDIFELSNLDNVENLDLSKDAGILVGTAPEQVKAYSTQYANPGLLKYVPGAEDQAAAGTGSLYFGVSDGIMTRELHQTLYLAGYVKLPNDQYIYSSVLEYSPSTYAYNMIEKYSATPDNNTYKLCVALLNYISAAQTFFETGGTLVNDGLKNINGNDLREMPETWDENTSPELKIITGKEISGKGVSITASDLFQTVNKTQIGNNLLFEKMLSIAALYQVNSDYITANDTSKCGTIIWTQEQWDSEEASNVNVNAQHGVKVPLTAYTNDVRAADSQWCSLIPEKIAAKDMVDEKYYFLGYIVKDGDVHYSGVKVYTVEQYIYNKVNDDTTEAAMVELAKRLYFYERAANAALKSTSSSN